MQLKQSQIDELKSMVNHALSRLYEIDHYLIENAVNERAVVFRFGLYLSMKLKESNFKGLDLDCEYNKNIGKPKRTGSHPNGAVPDMLLHRRHSNDENTVVLEFKGYWNKAGRETDQQKIIEFTNQEGQYKYALGAFIEINLEGYNVLFFQDYAATENAQSTESPQVFKS